MGCPLHYRLDAPPGSHQLPSGVKLEGLHSSSWKCHWNKVMDSSTSRATCTGCRLEACCAWHSGCQSGRRTPRGQTSCHAGSGWLGMAPHGPHSLGTVEQQPFPSESVFGGAGGCLSPWPPHPRITTSLSSDLFIL